MSDDSGESSSDSVDLASTNFNPLKALYSSSVKLPCPDAPVLDNLTKFVETDEGITVKCKPEKKVKSEDASEPSTSGRRFEPHQEPVQGRRKNKHFKDVLTRMENAEGPFARLKDYMENRTKVKIVTRNMNSIRGHCTGYVVAFDKHWNIALEDVREVWARAKKLKQPALGQSDDLYAESRIRANIPRIVVRSETKRRQVCERHVNKMLLRGEHIVSVCVDPEK